MRKKYIMIAAAAVIGFILWRKFGDQIMTSVRNATSKK